MSVTATGYMKARAEIVALFGWNAGGLTPEQTLRADCATALRLGLDALQGALIRGESVDMAKMLTASEALSRLLPAAVLSAPPEERREDPRKALLELILQMRERDGVGDAGLDERDDEIARLQAENEQLRRVAMAAGLAVPHAACAAPTEVDITPPSEIGEFYRGAPRPAPDDPKPPTVIDADAVDIRAGFSSDNSDQSWRNFATDTDGVPLTARGRRYWGPV